MRQMSPLARWSCALGLSLAAGCTSLPAMHGAAPALQAAHPSLPETRLSPTEALQWLDRVGWGATGQDLVELQHLGLKSWLAWQLAPAPDALPPAVEQQIASLSISRQPMPALLQELDARRLAVKNAVSPEDKTRLQQALQRRLNQLGTEAQQRFVLRALYSRAQLQEKMSWFWLNHFSISMRKADLRAWAGDYEEQAIRPHALGNFRDLLGATLRHPAMLRYLDNASNAVGRINENHARELLELHTMGVGSGYTQADVQAMARILTGAGINLQPAGTPPPRLQPKRQADYLRSGFFEFNPARHDYGPKRFLGRPMQAHGMAEIEEALDRIVASPATARLIAYKLAVFLVADEPPPALVERTALAFRTSHADIAATVAALLTAPEAAHFGQKYRDPLHYVLACTRLVANGRIAADAMPVLNWVRRLGQAPYAHETPEGYPLRQSDWAGPGQMAARFEVARQIATRSTLLFRADPKALLSEQDWLGQRLDQWSPASQAALAQARDPVDWSALLLSTPEMMYR
ncbi:DUF1800 domain-containing protein [Comamonas composti]|uniref:DUF1800 domain-containing protein n=1 Tax=Comamonas composti TaxID=408558 RepID=UPI00047B23AA